MSSLSSARPSYSFQWIALLGLLTALGPLSIDMYLPALPEMAVELGTTTIGVSSSIPAYFLGLAVGQLVYGTLSDRIGRKKPLYIGLIIYIIGSLLCVFANDEMTLILSRILQAFGGCVGVVMARAAIRDCFDVNTSAQALAHMAMILGIAPIIAPLIGTLMIQFLSWHSIFVLLAFIGMITLLCVHFFFKETLAEDRRLTLSFGQIVILYSSILKDSSFRTPMLAMSFFSGMLFCYLTTASAILMDYLGFNEHQFAITFGVNAFGIMIFSFLGSKVVRKIGALPLLHLGGTLQLVGVIVLGLSSFINSANTLMILSALFLIVSGVGFTGPSATALALANQQQRAGTASALLGSVQFAFGLFVGLIVYALQWSVIQNVAAALLIYAVLGLFCVYMLRLRMRKYRKL